ncbi:MAG TPA: TlpA disulfide reductase family protein [Holophagaceae bacterium]|nr:TlpA disulfide reductase family protein [Holophagaceae bacterium]
MPDTVENKGGGSRAWLKALLAGMGGLVLMALLLFGGLVWLLRSSLSRGESGLAPKGQDVSAVAYLDASGARHTLAEEKGRVVVVDLWATWCPPCLKTLPGLAKLAAAGGQDFAVIPISVDNDGFSAVAPFLQRRPDLAALPGLVPDGVKGLAPLGTAEAIPTTFLVGRDGKVLDAWSGVDEARLEAGLKRALGR